MIKINQKSLSVTRVSIYIKTYNTSSGQTGEETIYELSSDTARTLHDDLIHNLEYQKRLNYSDIRDLQSRQINDNKRELSFIKNSGIYIYTYRYVYETLVTYAVDGDGRVSEGEPNENWDWP